jgi:hypothetical protein
VPTTLTLNGSLTNGAGSITEASLQPYCQRDQLGQHLAAHPSGLLNLTLNRSGSQKHRPEQPPHLFNGGTLHLREGYFRRGSYTLSIGQSPAALCKHHPPHGRPSNQLPVFNGKVNLTYTANTKTFSVPTKVLALNSYLRYGP